MLLTPCRTTQTKGLEVCHSYIWIVFPRRDLSSTRLILEEEVLIRRHFGFIDRNQEDFHRSFQERRVDSICEKPLLETKEYISWVEETSYPVLQLCGQGGGKSTTASFLVDHLRPRCTATPMRPVLCYYYHKVQQFSADKDQSPLPPIFNQMVLSIITQDESLKSHLVKILTCSMENPVSSMGILVGLVAKLVVDNEEDDRTLSRFTMLLLRHSSFKMVHVHDAYHSHVNVS